MCVCGITMDSFFSLFTVARGRGENDARTAGHQERGQTGSQTASGGEGGHGHAEQYRTVLRRYAGHDCL